MLRARCRDVTGRVVVVDVTREETTGGFTVDALRARVAAAYGYPGDHVAVMVVAREKVRGTTTIADAFDVGRGGGGTTGTEVEATVVGFARRRRRRVRVRGRSGTTTKRASEDEDGNDFDDDDDDDGGGRARSATTKALFDEIRGDATRSASTSTTNGGLVSDALRALANRYEATTKVCLFLRRQHMQPTMRVIAQAMVGGGNAGEDAGTVGLSMDDARAMETLCPGSIRLTARTRATVRLPPGEDPASPRERPTTDIFVDVTAPDEDEPSAFALPGYLRAVGDGVVDAAKDAVALHGARPSLRSVGGHSRSATETTRRFGAHFGKAVGVYRAAFERGLREVIERVPFESTKETTLDAYVEAVREIREREATAKKRDEHDDDDDDDDDGDDARVRNRSSTMTVPPEAMDRPPAPPRLRAKRKQRAGAEESGDAGTATTKKDATKDSGGHCRSTEPMDVKTFVEHLTQTLGARGQIKHVETMTPKTARRVAWSPEKIQRLLSDATIQAFAGVGIDLTKSLFSHQASAIEAILGERLNARRRHVIVSSGTASGKSVCYNVPTIETLLGDPTATALYMFPTKALAQDQLRALRNILSSVPRGEETVFDVGVFDGDTREDARVDVRANSRLIITNPDMLHVSIMPAHKQWAKFLSGLRYVVIDEAHAYSGVFGSHVALIVRRLRRICAEIYGSCPQFIISSATVANPGEHARDLIGWRTRDASEDEIEVVTNDGAPRGEKTFLLWNPTLKPGQTSQTNTERKFRRQLPIERGKAALAKRLRNGEATTTTTAAEKQPGEVDARRPAEDGARTSPVVDISQILAECVQHNLRCLAFCKTRKLCELVLVYTREILRSSAPHLADKVASYRGGYEAGERRVIEKELFSGSLLGVATTNALELGIDVGSLDVTLHLGFPGSVASLWQQAGRAGRREGHALSIYVAFDGPLDQHFMRQPRALFDAPLEMSYVDPRNPSIVEQHLACAAYELPLFANGDVDEVYFGDLTRGVAQSMVRKGRIAVDPTALVRGNAEDITAHPLLACATKTPALDVSVRTIEEERYEVFDQSKATKAEPLGKVISSIEASKAFFEVYEGAVYTHQGRTLLCQKLDMERRRAFVRQADVKYFTRVKHETVCFVPGGQRAYGETDSQLPLRQCVKCDDVEIRTVFTGFSRVARGSQAKFDQESFPPRETRFDTVGAWLRIPDSVCALATDAGIDLRAGVHAASHALLNALPLHIPCGENDVGCECFSADLHAERGRRYAPHRFLIYDRHLGGVGITSRASKLFPELISRAKSIVDDCACSRADGCPSCVQRLSCDAHNAHVNRAAAKFLLEHIQRAFAPEQH